MTELPPFGRYQLIRKLGEGNYAEVWLAQDTALGRPVALKVLKPGYVSDGDTRARFMAEARSLAVLQHPRIAWLLDSGEVQGRAFLALRFIEGLSLDQLLRRRAGLRLEWAEAVRIILDAAEGLEFAHRKGLVHRDIKPQNILLSPQGGAVLTDFGLVRALEGGESGTRSGVLLGTPAYMAPELWQGQPASPAADQYALACTLVELVSGVQLFGAPNSAAAMHRHFQPPQFPDGLPAAGRAVLLRALHPDPQARYESMLAFGQALYATLSAAARPQKAGPGAPPPEPASPGAGSLLKNLAEELDDSLERMAALGRSLVGREESEAEPVEHGDELAISLAPGVEMILQHVPAGVFLYGERNWEVHLDEYWIGKYPVTNAQFGAFLLLARYPWEEKLPRGKDDHPVVNVSWHDAAAFCAWVARVSRQPVRLPTEAEYEKAARGPNGRAYPWGEQAPDKKLCNFNELFKGTTPVGKFSPQGDSPYGCADLAGSVWEWTADWYDPHALDQNPGPNPAGPAGWQHRVCRGGSWANDAGAMRSTFRSGDSPAFRSHYHGFRCAR